MIRKVKKNGAKFFFILIVVLFLMTIFFYFYENQTPKFAQSPNVLLSSDFRDSYAPKETAIGKLSGNINGEINSNQIKIKRNNVEIAVEYGVRKVENEYYIWFVSPIQPANYTLVVEDIVIGASGALQNENYEKNFEVSGNEIPYTVKPGAISFAQDFEITVVINGINQQNIQIDFPYERQVNLFPGSHQIKFFVNEIEGIFSGKIGIGMYQIPAFVVGHANSNNETNESEEQNEEIVLNGNNDPLQNSSEQNFSDVVDFRFVSSAVIVGKNNTNQTEKIIFEIENLGSSNLSGIQFVYNREKIKINPESGFTINSGEIKDFEVVIIDWENVERELIIAYAGNQSRQFLLMVNESYANENPQPTYIEENQVNSYFYCSELRGSICFGEDVCSGEQVSSVDGACCLSSCVPKEETGYSWIGYLISGILLLVLIYIFFKYKKTGQNRERVIKNKFNFAEKNLP